MSEGYDPNFINPLKFYPVKGSTQRKAGQGCTSCIHKPYCQDFYWLRRNLEYSLSPDYGTSCASWSNNRADYVQGATYGDLQLIERWKYMGIAGEKDECGIELES
jgi:hypothetical protein